MSERQTLPDTGELLFELAPRLTRLENALLKELAVPLTFRQYRLLLRVSRGSSTLSQLRKPSTLTLAAVSESVDGLVQRGLLRRVADERDRRAVTISITAEGERALAAGTAVLDGLAADLFDGLEPDAAEHVHGWLTDVADQVTERLRERRA